MTALPTVGPSLAPAWFVFRGHYRAEFITFDQAMAWASEHGGVVTDSPTGDTAPRAPTAGNVEAYELNGAGGAGGEL